MHLNFIFIPSNPKRKVIFPQLFQLFVLSTSSYWWLTVCLTLRLNPADHWTKHVVSNWGLMRRGEKEREWDERKENGGRGRILWKSWVGDSSSRVSSTKISKIFNQLYRMSKISGKILTSVLKKKTSGKQCDTRYLQKVWETKFTQVQCIFKSMVFF